MKGSGNYLASVLAKNGSITLGVIRLIDLFLLCNYEIMNRSSNKCDRPIIGSIMQVLCTDPP